MSCFCLLIFYFWEILHLKTDIYHLPYTWSFKTLCCYILSSLMLGVLSLLLLSISLTVDIITFTYYALTKVVQYYIPHFSLHT